MEYLIRHGADVKKRTLDQDTILHSAIRTSNIAGIDFALNHFELNIQGSRGNTPLLTAAESSQNPNLLKFFLEHSDLQATNAAGLSFFHIAVMNRNKAAIFQGLQKGMDINEKKGDRGITPLQAAAGLSDRSFLKYLVRPSIGADVYALNQDGDSFLHEAIRHMDTVAIEFAIDHNLSVQQRGHQGLTPLLFAAKFCSPTSTSTTTILERLFEVEEDSVCDEDDHGNSLLDIAAEAGNILAVQFALDHGLKVGEGRAGRNALARLQDDAAPCLRKLLKEAYKKELPVCGLCEEVTAQIQFLPCNHRNTCAPCSDRWKKCICGDQIVDKLDVLDSPKR